MTEARKAILFDFGNVLVKWNLHPVLSRFFSSPEAVDSFLTEISFYEWNAIQDKGRPYSEGVAVESKKFPQYAHIFRALDEEWLETIREPIPETSHLARDLKRAGHSIYVLTNCSAEKFPQAREIHPFLSIFDDAIVSGEVGLIKPDPAIFHYTLTRIGRDAQECIFIDDSLPNIESARGVGIPSIHFQSPIQLQHELSNLITFPRG